MTLPQTESLRFRERDGVPVVVFPALEAVPFVRHGFSTRLGGVSEGCYASMNLSFTRGDREEEKAGIFLTGRVVIEDRVVTPPAANLEFDQLAMSENEKADKSFLLQSLQCG